MEPFIGQIILFGGNFAPRGWALCDGQLLDIQSHSALFSILGTTYGGDGRSTFALPDLRGRVALHPGTGPGLSPHNLGQKGGAEKVTLSEAEMPSHHHGVHCANVQGSLGTPVGNVLAGDRGGADEVYAPTGTAKMDDDMIERSGGSQGHDNMQPFTCLNYLIALQGTFPARN